MEAIRREGLGEHWPRATDADLFLWVSQRRRELFPERGGMDIDEAVRASKDTGRKGAAKSQTDAMKSRLLACPTGHGVMGSGGTSCLHAWQPGANYFAHRRQA